MKVATLFVTRAKINLEQYNLLSEVGYETTSKYLEGILSKKVNGTNNYLINCGMTWAEMVETFDEIKSKDFDAIIFWITPSASKLKIFYPRFCQLLWAEFNETRAIKLQHIDSTFIHWNSGQNKNPVFGFKTPYLISL